MMKAIRILCVFACAGLLVASAGAQDNPELVKAVTLAAEGKRAEAIEILKKLSAENPNEEVYFQLGNNYALDGKHERAAAIFEDGVARFPLSARLYNGAAMAHEQQMNIAKALVHYRKAVALQPNIAYVGGGRYEPQYDAIFIPVIHDHRGANACSGRLYIDDEKMHFVVYYVFSGWGPGNDDSFETPFANIGNTEVDRKQGVQTYDYSIITLLTNLTGPRRRITAGEQARVDLKFTFETPIKGYRGNPWTKPDIKFFFVEPELGERLTKYLEGKKVRTTAR